MVRELPQLNKKTLAQFQRPRNPSERLARDERSGSETVLPDRQLSAKSGLLRMMVFGQKPNLLSNSDLITSPCLGSI